MKKTIILTVLLVSFLFVTDPLLATRTWIAEQIKVSGAPITSLEHPTLALQLGSMPVVVTNGEPTGSPTPKGVRRTPFGWEYYLGPSYIAGDGARNIVTGSFPVNYGADGYFYSASGYMSPVYPYSYRNGGWFKIGPQWPYSSGGSPNQPGVSADATGKVYMVVGTNLAMLSGGVWSTAKNLSMDIGISTVSELAVSPYGEVAISGYGMSSKIVAWYNFKTAAWHTRSLTGPGPNSTDTIGIEWDSRGNLGVAYSDNYTGSTATMVQFDYLDMSTGDWTREVVIDNSTGMFRGAALAYDRFANPVIASGQFLIYDPVPEPTSILMIVFSLWCLLRRR